ncbi:MAG: hypothetical protein HOC20_11545 [Chloroflexi bacterium]|jgi:hypothetical protein|nr:hypothetical protein [Chloroflexota bacterium]
MDTIRESNKKSVTKLHEGISISGLTPLGNIPLAKGQKRPMVDVSFEVSVDEYLRFMRTMFMRTISEAGLLLEGLNYSNSYENGEVKIIVTDPALPFQLGLYFSYSNENGKVQINVTNPTLALQFKRGMDEGNFEYGLADSMNFFESLCQVVD